MPDALHPIEALPPFRKDKTVNVVVETPAGYRSKIKYEPETGMFSLGKFLPEGFSFPFDFGFIPGTLAEDGDPLDVMLIAETGTAPGCLVPARLLGVLKAEERSTEAGKGQQQGQPIRNDRLLAIPLASRQYAELSDLDQIPGALREQLEHFLVSYVALDRKQLAIVGLEGPEGAAKLVRDAAREKQP